MPIKAFNTSQYEQVPDEDVTPVNYNLSRLVQRNEKTFRTVVAVTIGVLCVVGIAFTGYYFFDISNTKDVVIFETAAGEQFSGGLNTVTIQHIRNTIPSLGTLKFGNTRGDNYVEASDGTARIVVDGDTLFQEIIGFGGAFTEASAYNFFKLPSLLQKKVIELYFGEDGINFSLGRIHINSCDFSLESYSFDDFENDYSLKHFDDNVTHDTLEIIPFIREAMLASSLKIRLVASPWSPPAWMKVPSPDTGKSSMLGSETPNGLRNEHRVKYAWAKYISRFVSAYKGKGVDIWAVTPQNEPEFPAPWEACSYNASFESQFINSFFGPIMKTDHPDVKILAFDHNKDHLEAWAKEILGKDKHGYVDGMAFHWYGGMDRMTDGTFGYEAVRATYEFAPNKLLLNTEGCSCPGIWLNNWLRAERLGHDILYDLMNYAQGWIDWNLLLDDAGGPNHLGNVCDASLLAMDEHTRLHVQPKYYYFAHFSKFILPGSRRVANSAIGDFKFEMMDPNIQQNMEISIYPCEKSTRQMWILNTGAEGVTSEDIKVPRSVNDSEINEEASKLRMFAATNAGEARDSGSNRLCVGYGDTNRAFLRLIDCDAEEKSLLHLQVRILNIFENSAEEAKSAGLFGSNLLTLQLEDTHTSQCITSTQSTVGALFRLMPCENMMSSSSASSVNSTETSNVHPEFNYRGNMANMLVFQHQVFQYDVTTYELTLPSGSIAASLLTQEMEPNVPGANNDGATKERMCVTAGWPFFNAIAFKVPSDFDSVVAYTKQKQAHSFDRLMNYNRSVSGSFESSSSRLQKWRTVIVAMNEASVSVPVSLYDRTRQDELLYAISPRSIQTIVYDEESPN
jgi:O-glycosyl hydrolase